MGGCLRTSAARLDASGRFLRRAAFGLGHSTALGRWHLGPISLQFLFRWSLRGIAASTGKLRWNGDARGTRRGESVRVRRCPRSLGCAMDASPQSSLLNAREVQDLKMHTSEISREINFLSHIRDYNFESNMDIGQIIQRRFLQQTLQGSMSSSIFLKNKTFLLTIALPRA